MAEASRPDILALHALGSPDKPAVIESHPDRPELSWSFAELDREANRLANVLHELGVRPRDKVLWCGRNSPGVIRMMHAASKLGVTAVPLNYRLAPDEAAYVTDNCDAVAVYVDAEYAELFRRIRPDTPKVRHIVVFDGAAPAGTLDGDALLLREPDRPPPAAEEASEGATMIYTSGTSGRPKGALRRGAGDPEQVAALLAAMGYRPDDVYLTTGPLYHSGPGGFMGLAHVLGNTVVVQRKFDPEDWLRLVDRYRVTSTFSAPTPIRMVCNLPAGVKARYDRSSMRLMVANAAPWSMALKEAYLADFPADSLWEVYGSTEAGVNTILRPEDQLRKPGSCGKPAPGVELKLIADDGEEVTEPGVPGELFIRSKGLFTTYYKAGEKHREALRGEYFSVGDVAFFDEEGYYFICDRKNDMIISGGMNVYPAEVEAVLEQHPAILDAAVFGIPSEEWGESVHAVVVPQPGAALDAETVITYARGRLAGYKIPRSVDFIEEIPRTGSGKILKRVLREPYWKGERTGVA